MTDTAVDHWIPARDSPLAPGNHRVSLTGERSVCKQYRSLPCQLQHAA
ncbi:unnamed protein product [Staurois parvus]|uniref:Uncharacterized protein n=1 Tax=Staurois parvus TaxID=386267 RepID=A0ABN9FTS1_9NEOB|nr:unnamed protein product [Staurois parvus]